MISLRSSQKWVRSVTAEKLKTETDRETGKQGDKETRRQGDKETRRQEDWAEGYKKVVKIGTIDDSLTLRNGPSSRDASTSENGPIWLYLAVRAAIVKVNHIQGVTLSCYANYKRQSSNLLVIITMTEMVMIYLCSQFVYSVQRLWDPYKFMVNLLMAASAALVTFTFPNHKFQSPDSKLP